MSHDTSECRLSRMEEEIAAELEPRRYERLIASRYARLLTRILETHPGLRDEAVSVEIQGSYAKDTWISRDFDLDVFIVFPRTRSRDWVRSRGFEMIREAVHRAGLPYTVDYAEHPYITVVLLGLEANLVPALEAGGERLSVYRTIHHTRYVSSRLRGWQKKHVRLLKSFLKAVDAYGADSRVQGVSGSLSELLILAYGCFPRAIKAISSWRPGIAIDPETGEARQAAGWRPGQPPLLVPDPVDPSRNAAAAVSAETLARLVLAAKAYTRAPCPDFYHNHASPPEKTPPPPERSAIICYRNPLLDRLPRDAVWGELHRIRRAIIGVLENLGYTVVYSKAATDESTTAIIGVEVFQEKPDPTPRRGPQPWTGDPLKFISKTLAQGMPVWIGPGTSIRSWRPRPRTLHGELDARWREYTVAPHFRGLKPRVYQWGRHPHSIDRLVAKLEERTPPWTRCLTRGRGV